MFFWVIIYREQNWKQSDLRWYLSLKESYQSRQKLHFTNRRWFLSISINVLLKTLRQYRAEESGEYKYMSAMKQLILFLFRKMLLQLVPCSELTVDWRSADVLGPAASDGGRAGTGSLAVVNGRALGRRVPAAAAEQSGQPGTHQLGEKHEQRAVCSSLESVSDALSTTRR